MVCQAPINLSDGDVIGQIMHTARLRAHARSSLSICAGALRCCWRCLACGAGAPVT